MVKRILSFLVAFSLLLAILYVPVIRHTCHLFDVTETALYSAEVCCSPGGFESERIDVNCCSLSIETYKADITVEVSLPTIELNVPFKYIDIELSQLRAFQKAETSYPVFGSPPLSLANRTLLNQIQIYRI